MDSDLGGSRGIGNTGYGSGTDPVTGSSHEGTLGPEAALRSGDDAGLPTTSTGSTLGQEPESRHREHTHSHKFEGDPCGPEGSNSGAPHFTAGPHVTDTANRLDPNVTSDVNVPIESADKPSDPKLGTSTHEDHHLGRDAALATGVGAAGAGAYESSRDTPSSSEPTTSTTQPHKSSLLNKLDPRVKSEKPVSEIPTDTGSGTTDPYAKDKDHRHDRDAGLVGAGAVTGYEAERGLGSHESTGPASSTGISNPYSTSELDPRVDSEAGKGLGVKGTDKDHHYGRDAGLVGAGGVAAYEAEKHLGKDHKPSGRSQIPESVGDSSYNRSENPVTSEYDKSTNVSNNRGQGFVGTGTEPHSETGPHHGRDAGLTGAGLGAGGVAAYEAEKHHDRDQPPSTSDPSTYLQSGYDKPTHSHTGRDDALAGGAGAGLGAAAESQLSQKEIEKLEKKQAKEIEKEEKAIHKEQVKHEKEIAKEAKKHEKAIAKEEKAIAKEEKALAKEEKKHDDDDGKKHGGILGLFHRDKPDQELKDEELEHQDHGKHHGAETAAGVGTAAAVGAEVEHEKDKHERNRLHKDPPAGYYDSSKYGENPQSGYAARVTGGTGTTALAEGDNLPSGPHLTEIGNKVDPR